MYDKLPLAIIRTVFVTYVFAKVSHHVLWLCLNLVITMAEMNIFMTAI